MKQFSETKIKALYKQKSQQLLEIAIMWIISSQLAVLRLPVSRNQNYQLDVCLVLYIRALLIT